MEKTILILEDNEAILDLLQMNFEDHSFKVIPYADAISVKESDLALASIILSDINMPKLTGIEWALEIRRNGNKTPIVFYTGIANNKSHYESELNEIKNYVFLTKPAPFNDLIKHVNTLLNQSMSLA